MHDVDVRLILIVHLIQNQLVLCKKIYFKIHGIVHCKGKKIVTIHLAKKVWAIKIWKTLENKGEVLVFRGLCIMLKFKHGVF